MLLRWTHADACPCHVTGCALLQYDVQGSPLFLHSNLHKWDMRLPEKFSLHYQRRWQVMLPGKLCVRHGVRANRARVVEV